MEDLPVFVKVENPDNVKELIEMLRNTIATTKLSIDKIQALSSEESAKISEWHEKFNSVNDKIAQIQEDLSG